MLPPGSRSPLVVGLDAEDRARATVTVDCVGADASRQVVGLAAQRGLAERVYAVFVGLRRRQRGPSAELSLRVTALDLHGAVGLHRDSPAAHLDLARRQRRLVEADVGA